MMGHNVPGAHIDGMVFESGKSGSVRLTLKIVQSWNKPFIIVYAPEGVEKIMGKHSQVGVFGRHADAVLEWLASF